MKCLLFSIVFLFSLQGNLNASEHAYGGIPSDEAYIERQGYIIQFDAEHNIPRCVAYHAKPEYLDTPDRTVNKWNKYRDDPDIVGEATKEDYEGQFNTWRNYAVGHLTPYFISGGDRDNDGSNAANGDEDDAKTVYEINYFTNMAPQHHNNFNGSGGLWYDLETFVRDKLLKEKKKEVWVFAGCILGPGSYDKIGKNVEVPPMFYKIIITEENNKPKIIAFLFPHQIKRHGEIQDFLVSINLIEAMTGLDFFPELNDDKMERKCTSENWE